MPAALVTSTNNGEIATGGFAPGSCALDRGLAAWPLLFAAGLDGAAVCAAPHKIQTPFSAISRRAAATVTGRFFIGWITVWPLFCRDITDLSITDRAQWPFPPKPVAPSSVPRSAGARFGLLRSCPVSRGLAPVDNAGSGP